MEVGKQIHLKHDLGCKSSSDLIIIGTDDEFSSLQPLRFVDSTKKEFFNELEGDETCQPQGMTSDIIYNTFLNILT